MPQKNVHKYQLCTECAWKSEPLTHVPLFIGRCPECDGFLILKSTRHKSSPTYRTRKTARAYATRDHDGFRLKRAPGGWKFVEGKRINPRNPLEITKDDERAINACLRRRGLYRSARAAMGIDEKLLENNS